MITDTWNFVLSVLTQEKSHYTKGRVYLFSLVFGYTYFMYICVYIYIHFIYILILGYASF